MPRESEYHNDRLEGRCYFCESGPPLEEHHIIPQRFDGPDSKENIVELCQLCHQRLERLYDSSFYEWFGIEDEEGEREYHRQCESGDCKNQAAVKTRELHRNGQYDGIWIRGTWPWDIRAGYYCRPCAAKMAKDAYERWHSNYWNNRLKMHQQARQARREGTKIIRPQPIEQNKPQSPDWVYEMMIVDER